MHYDKFEDKTTAVIRGEAGYLKIIEINRMGQEDKIIEEITKKGPEDTYQMFDGFNTSLYTGFEGGTLFLVHGRPDEYLSIMQKDPNTGKFVEVQQIKEKYRNARYLVFSEKYNILLVGGLERGIRVYKKNYTSGQFEVA